VAFTVLFFVC